MAKREHVNDYSDNERNDAIRWKAKNLATSQLLGEQIDKSEFDEAIAHQIREISESRQLILNALKEYRESADYEAHKSKYPIRNRGRRT